MLDELAVDTKVEATFLFMPAQALPSGRIYCDKLNIAHINY